MLLIIDEKSSEPEANYSKGHMSKLITNTIMHRLVGRTGCGLITFCKEALVNRRYRFEGVYPSCIEVTLKRASTSDFSGNVLQVRSEHGVARLDSRKPWSCMYGLWQWLQMYSVQNGKSSQAWQK
jgi:hypothetical protein